MTSSSKYYILRIKQGHRFDFKDFGFPVEDSLIKVGTDVLAQALDISEVNFCPGIRFWDVNFARALGFWQFSTKNV